MNRLAAEGLVSALHLGGFKAPKPPAGETKNVQVHWPLGQKNQEQPESWVHIRMELTAKDVVRFKWKQDRWLRWDVRLFSHRHDGYMLGDHLPGTQAGLYRPAGTACVRDVQAEVRRSNNASFLHAWVPSRLSDDVCYTCIRELTWDARRSREADAWSTETQPGVWERTTEVCVHCLRELMHPLTPIITKEMIAAVDNVLFVTQMPGPDNYGRPMSPSFQLAVMDKTLY